MARAAAAGSAMPASAAANVPPAKPQRLGLVAGLLALIAVLCIGSFIAYKIMFATEPKEAAPTTAAPATDTTPPLPAQPADAPKDGAAPGSTATGTPDSGAASQADAAANAPGTDAKSAAPTDASKAASANATKSDKAAGKGGTPGKTDTPTTTAAPAAPAAQPPRPAAAPVAAAPKADRWELMRQAYEVCSREGLLDRISCNSRVGRQYCEGYWGQVPQCPVGAYGDRAN